jgi:antitoxin component YwqK of YwqJK toxin-antitoxin module
MKIYNKYLLLLPFLLFCSYFSLSQQDKKGQLPFKTVIASDTIFNKKEIIIRNGAKDTLEISDFKNGKLQGKQILFFDNGEIKRIANYKDGLIKGKVEYYVQNNHQIIRVEHFKAIQKDSISVLHGKTTSNYQNGGIREQYIYKNGRKNGKYTIYQQSGNVKEKGKYEEDLNIGNKLTYGNNGNLQKDENYIIIDNPDYKDVISNDETKANDNSYTRKEIRIEPKKLSVLGGKAKYYYYNGLISADFQFKKGLKDGTCKEYHQDQNNRLKSSMEFKNGLQHGSFINYKSDGSIERKGIFYREIKVGDTVYKNVYDGEIRVYTSAGRLQRIQNWEYFMQNGVQEDYSYSTGKLSHRMYFKDNLKSGIEERFDAEDLKRYEAHFEIVEIDGKRISQQTGIETSWDKGKIRSVTLWRNGKREGISKSYYENGGVERVMNYSNGELDGLYRTYYENGQLKEDYMYHRLYNTRKHIGWNKIFNESGELTRIFHAQGNDKNNIGLNFENGQLIELGVSDGFSLSVSDTRKIENINWQKQGRPFFGYHTFTNGKLRKVTFDADRYNQTTANFTSNGQLIQVYTNTGNSVEKKSIDSIAKMVAAQYNANWNNEKLITEGFEDGKIQWNYKDGSPFFNIQFKDSLPSGTWISFNPIDGDTLVHAEFIDGLPVGKWIKKSIDGVLLSKVNYFPNHKVKENYRYGEQGILNEYKKFDSLGNETTHTDYFENGNLKSMRDPILGNNISMWPNGDTSNFNFLFTDGDSIKLERQFYEGNILRLQRKNNLTTGLGEVKTYYENGQLKTLHERKDDKTHGVYKRFDTNGKLLNSGFFKDGKRHGQWIKYDKKGEAEISQFENGEFIIVKSEDDENSCRCYDKSLKAGEIGYAGSLSQLEEYENIKGFIPKTIVPIDSFNYNNIFYVGLQTSNSNSGGFASMKLLMFKEFAFHYPAVNYLKFNLNPCKTEGYISNIEGNFNFDYSIEKTVFGYLATKTISIGLVENPLVNYENKPYAVQFETKGIRFDENDITNIKFVNKESTCYPLGIINDLMKIEITKAELDIKPSNGKYYNVPLLPNEAKQFYGFDISEATITFDYVNNGASVEIRAYADRIVAGSNYVAGKIEVEGKSDNENEFTLKNSKTSINIEELQRFLEKKGFYRVKLEIKEGLLFIEFYAEK